jgi:hypothetical protein
MNDFDRKIQYIRAGKRVPFDLLSEGCKRVHGFAKANGSINPMQALNECGVMRLAARIKELEDSGYPFWHEPVDSVNRFGEKVRFMEYRLVM